MKTVWGFEVGFMVLGVISRRGDEIVVFATCESGYFQTHDEFQGLYRGLSGIEDGVYVHRGLELVAAIEVRVLKMVEYGREVQRIGHGAGVELTLKGTGIEGIGAYSVIGDHVDRSKLELRGP